MSQPKCIGLFGGIGVGTANHYYSQLFNAHTARSLLLDLTMVHADINRTLAAIEANDPASLATYFAEIIHRLQSAGADFAVIPSVTSHCALTDCAPSRPFLFSPRLAPTSSPAAPARPFFGLSSATPAPITSTASAAPGARNPDIRRGIPSTKSATSATSRIKSKSNGKLKR